MIKKLAEAEFDTQPLFIRFRETLAVAPLNTERGGNIWFSIFPTQEQHSNQFRSAQIQCT